MNRQEPTTIKARYVFPVAAAPIRDGAVTIAAGRIVAVGRIAPAGGKVIDLGNCALLPGLVNAHTHLEFSGLDAPLGRPGMGFVDWIREVMAWRRTAGHADPTKSLPVERGLAECRRSGTTTLGEIAQPGWSAEPFERAGIRTTVFLELIGTSQERAEQAIDQAMRHVESDGGASGWTPGLSPHAPYSAAPELLAQAVSISQRTGAPLAMHLAESREEIELLRTGGGPFREFLQDLGVWNDGQFGGQKPLDYLEEMSAAARALVIHGNYPGDEEIGFLAERSARMAVVYCPRTHAYFGHDPYPLAKMLRAGVTVALGTDSRASSPDLSILAEMRSLARHHPEVPPHEVLELGTLRGARALGQAAETGTLEPGKAADLVAVALPERDAADPHELLFDSESSVTAVWTLGERRSIAAL